MKRSHLIGLLALSLLSTAGRAVAQDSTRYGGDPMLLGAGARPLGMGSAFVAISDDATAVYWNPAGLARLSRRETQFQHAEQFGGTVNHDVFTLAGPSPVGGFGMGLLRLGVDGVKLTALEDPSRPLGPDNRPLVSRVVGTSDYTLILAYGRKVRTNLSIGAGLKLIWRRLSVGSGSGYGIDLGALYTPRPELSAGLVLRNLTRTRISFDSGAADRIPPSLLLGVAYTRMVPAIRGRITWSISLHIGEEKSGLEDAEGIHTGAEYLFRKVLAFRIGAEGDHFTAGAGIRLYERFGFDLAFLEHGQLDNTYRISASFYF